LVTRHLHIRTPIMEACMRRLLPALAAPLAGLIVLADFLFESPLLDAVGSFLLEGAIILGAFALILGLFNLLQVHERRVRRRERGWGESILILLSALGTLALGLLAWQTPSLDWFYRYVLFPLEASAGALLAFAAARAAMRVWRAGSREGAVLLAAGLLVLLGSLPTETGPLGMLAPVRNWIVAVPVLAAIRGILLGVALGVTATGLRLLLAMDRPYEEEKAQLRSSADDLLPWMWHGKQGG
jgi:hypothetical protein